MTPLTSETRCLLYCAPSAFSKDGQPFGSVEFTKNFEGMSLFHKLAFHEYRRDVASDEFLEQINAEDLSRAFVTPDARTLRGLMGPEGGASLGIDPGLSFAWPRDCSRPLPRGLSESVVLSVPFI